MDNTAKEINLVKLVHFSGTGGTARVADYFEKSFRDRGIEVIKCELRKGESLRV